MSKRRIHWIVPGEEGYAARIEFFLTNDSRQKVTDSFNNNKENKLLHCSNLRAGGLVGVSYFSFNCGPVDLNMPISGDRSFHKFGDVKAPDVLPHGRTRTLRIFLMPPDSRSQAVWEIAGYEIDNASDRLSKP